MDALSQLLRRLNLETRVFHRASLCGRWAVEGPFERKAMFHLVGSGRCVLATVGGLELELGSGDVVVFPRPVEHRVVPHPQVGQIQETLLLCGYFELGSPLAELLLSALPDRIVLQAAQPSSRGAGDLLALILDEVGVNRPGGAALVDKLSDALFVYVLRHCLDARPQRAGLLGALADSHVGPALLALHAVPAAPWTVASLAQRAGLSRAPFARRFASAVGVAPMAYATQLRMELARAALAQRGLSVGEAAALVGYATEAAFSRAFKRCFGQSPGALRRMSVPHPSQRAPAPT